MSYLPLQDDTPVLVNTGTDFETFAESLRPYGLIDAQVSALWERTYGGLIVPTEEEIIATLMASGPPPAFGIVPFEQSGQTDGSRPQWLMPEAMTTEDLMAFFEAHRESVLDQFAEVQAAQQLEDLQAAFQWMQDVVLSGEPIEQPTEDDAAALQDAWNILGQLEAIYEGIPEEVEGISLEELRSALAEFNSGYRARVSALQALFDFLAAFIIDNFPWFLLLAAQWSWQMYLESQGYGLGGAIYRTLQQNAANQILLQSSHRTPIPTPRPNLDYPVNQLPTGGSYPYRPPKRKDKAEYVKNPQGRGYIDENGNIWVWDPSGHAGPHWDVQDPRTGKHTNVYPDGESYQGPGKTT